MRDVVEPPGIESGDRPYSSIRDERRFRTDLSHLSHSGLHGDDCDASRETAGKLVVGEFERLLIVAGMPSDLWHEPLAQRA
jgi:hypothetical protein